jgi:hypothetical protein
LQEEKEMRQQWYSIGIISLLIGLLTGCGVAQYVEEKFTTISDVIDEARVDLEQGSGIRTVVKGEEKQSLQTKNQRPNELKSSFILQQDFTNRPQAIHSIRTYLTDQEPIRSEFYFINGMVYQQTGMSGWQKKPGQMSRLNLPYDPRYLLRSLSQDLDKGGIQMKVQGNDFVLTVNEQASQTILKPFVKEFLLAYQQLGNEGQPPLSEMDVRTEDFAQTIWVDKYTKRLRKMKMHIKLVANRNHEIFYTEQTTELTIPHRFIKPIQLPAKVKEEAI